eukprot:11995809-Alexandrium_andersonii.AAC.1
MPCQQVKGGDWRFVLNASASREQRVAALADASNGTHACQPAARPGQRSSSACAPRPQAHVRMATSKGCNVIGRRLASGA